MEAKRLYTLKDLKVGQVLTEITREGDYKIWEVLGRDPKLNPKGDLYEKYIYVLDSWGRVEVKRWYVSDLEIKEVYEGFPKETGERLVNINTIEQLIYNGVRYIVK